VARLLLITPAELSRDPRARRAAAAAHSHGLGVVGLCGRISGEEPASLPGVDVVRVGPQGRTDSSWITGGALRPAGHVVRELRGLYRLARLVLRTLRLVRGGRTWGGVAVVHANDFDTLPAGYLIARESRARLVYDAHELYSEFDPDPPRLYRAVAFALERALARRADSVVTVSEAIADELERRLGLPRRPLVVLNAPARDERDLDAEPEPGPLRAIYQGAFGTGRPLEDLLAAVRDAPGVSLTLRVPRAEPAALRAAVAADGLDGRVDVADPVPPDGVVDGLRGFDVGVVFDRPATLNGALGAPNKLFEYLMAGLAVVAPRLPGLEPIVEGEGVGVTYEPGRPELLAAALARLASDRELLAELRSRARSVALGRYNAEAQAARLAEAWGLPG
jgi:glycosyltransferase involved in cell wall biosynthesis